MGQTRYLGWILALTCHKKLTCPVPLFPLFYEEHGLGLSKGCPIWLMEALDASLKTLAVLCQSPELRLPGTALAIQFLLDPEEGPVHTAGN